jgi:hypothetical protein
LNRGLIAAVFVAIAGVLYIIMQSRQFSDWPPPPNAAVGALAQAIAIAEGSPSSWNNPGDLTIGDATGYQLQVDANSQPVTNSAGVVRFVNLGDGVNALYRKLGRIAIGGSGVYSVSMSLGQFAEVYTGGDNATGWASTVATELGLQPTDTVGTALEVQS